MVPDPGNPAIVDISQPGSLTWTASVYNAANPAGPGPTGTTDWECSTVSTNPCPFVQALATPNTPSITFADSSFQVDTYTVTLLFNWTDPNFVLVDGSNSAQTSVTFTTTNSGGTYYPAAEPALGGPGLSACPEDPRSVLRRRSRSSAGVQAKPRPAVSLSRNPCASRPRRSLRAVSATMP
jgi:hypothetical protein